MQLLALSQSIFDISFIPLFTGYLWEISVLFSLYFLKEAGKKTDFSSIQFSDGFVYIILEITNIQSLHFEVKSAETVLHTQVAWFNLAEFEFGIEYTALAGMTQDESRLSSNRVNNQQLLIHFSLAIKLSASNKIWIFCFKTSMTHAKAACLAVIDSLNTCIQWIKLVNS